MILAFLKKAYEGHRQDIPNTFWMFLFGAGKHGFIVGVFLIGAAMLNPHDFGLYNYITAILLLLVLFGDFGISTATSKLVAELRALEHHERLKSVMFNSTILTLGFVGITTVGLLVIANYFLIENTKYLLTLLPTLIFLPLAYLYSGIYRGAGRFKEAAVMASVTALISLVAAFFLIKFHGLTGALWSNNIFSSLFFTALIFNHGDEWSRVLDSKMMRNIGAYSIVLGATSLSHYIYSRVDIILLGHFGYISEIGFYEIVNKAFLFLVIPAMLVAHALAPTIAGLSARKQFGEIELKYRQIVVISGGIAAVITLIAYFLGPVILDSYFPQYSDLLFARSFNIMLIMLVGQSIAAIVASGFSVSTGHAKLNLKFLFAFGVLNIPLTYFFIAKLGFIGAVYSTVLVRCLTDVLFITSYYLTIHKLTR